MTSLQLQCHVALANLAPGVFSIAFFSIVATFPSHSTSLKLGFLFGLDFLIENGINIFRHRFAEGVHERFVKYGSTHTSRILLRGIVNTIDPRNLETVLKTKAEHYTIIPARKKLVTGLLGKGAFATEGDEWKHSRYMLRNGLACCELTAEVLDVHASGLIDSVRRKGERAAFDPSELALQYTMEVTSQALFGESTDTLNSVKDVRAVKQSFAADFTELCRMMRSLTIFFAQFPALERRKSMDNTTCEGALSAKSKNMAIVDGIAACKSDVYRIRSEPFNVLLAGHESVGLALSEMMWLLAGHPHVWARLRSEVLREVKGEYPTIPELRKMTYLGWTISEALRLRPPLSVHGRIATQETTLPVGGGPDGNAPLFVSIGTYVLYSHYALSRNPAVFGDDVESFRPERWADARPGSFESLSFGSGPRHCPGKAMSWCMLAFATARLAQEVDWIEARDARYWEEDMSFSFRNRLQSAIAMGFARQ